jgi:hypothetical protein
VSFLAAWQVEVLEDFPFNQRQSLVAPLALDEFVWTADDRRQWGSLEVGDWLFAANGSPTKVVRRFDVGRVRLYRVVFRDGASLRVSGDHLWTVQTAFDLRHGGQWRTVSTDQLLGMKMRHAVQRHVRVPRQLPIQLPEADLPLDPYIFGLWLGDGVRNESGLVCPDPTIRQELTCKGFAYRPRRRGDVKGITLYGMRGRLGRDRSSCLL